MSGIGWSVAHLRDYRWRIAALTALSAGEVGLRVLLPWPMKAVVDYALGSQPSPAWLRAFPHVWGTGREALLVDVVLAGLLIQVAHQTVLMAHTRLYSETGHLITRDMRQRLFIHLQALGLRQHSRIPVGEAVYRLESDAGCLEQLLLRGMMPFTFSVLTLVVMFVVLARLNLSVALASLSVVPFLLVWIKWSAGRIRPGAERTRRLESRMTARLHESFAAIRLIKSFAREPYEQQRFSGTADAAMQARVGLSAREALFSSVVGTLTILGTSAVVLTGGLLVLHGRLTVGTLLVALAYLGFVYGPLSGIANTTSGVQQALVSGDRVRNVLALSPEVSGGVMTPARFEGRIDFEHVSFAYQGRPVIRDISFTAHPGEFIALVGPSGSGKTTLLSLIPRLYEPSDGRILIDGTDAALFRLPELRQQVAIVLQEAIVLSSTVRDNLRYGRLDATPEEVEAAARAAHADEFIRALPSGYDTELGEAGSGLSGGQKQRLSIARAFLKAAPILILDEPTAALDTVSERLVFNAVAHLREGRTTFVIAHRLSTVRYADRIVVLDAGRIVAEGTHETLLRTSDLYRALSARLTSGSTEDAG